MSSFRPDEWQYAASIRLQLLLTEQKLRALVGDFERTLRADRREESNQDRPSHKDELADALLVIHDIDLLSNAEVRKAVAAGARKELNENISIPKRWVSGGPAAMRFTEAVQLPIVLAGTPTPPKPDATYTVVPPALHRHLEDYQEQVSYEMYRRMRMATSPDNRAIVSLPTGAGKTRVAVETIHQWSHDTINEGAKKRVAVAWLAHTEELCEQAVACFEEVWRSKPGGQHSLRIARYWAAYRHELHNAHSIDELILDSSVLAIISTPQSFYARGRGQTQLHETLGIDAIVIDEAHRAAAPTYKSIIKTYGNDATLIGLTATPFRNVPNQQAPLEGTRELRDVFKNLILPHSLGEDPSARLKTLQSRGILSKPLTQSVETNIRLATPNLDNPDNLPAVINYDQALQRSADQTRRRRIVINEVLKVLDRFSAARVLYFGPSVEDAELVAFLLRTKGKRAAAISGTTKDSTRRSIVNDFRRGRLDVLCNCEVLTAGFDAPQVTHVIMARPTISQILYEQMVGRGLRGPRFGGTEHCVIVDFVDRYQIDRPELGWEGFRAVWEPDKYRPTLDEKQVSLLFELSPSKIFNATRSTDGMASLKFKPLSRTVEYPVTVSFFGRGSGRLFIEVAHEKDSSNTSTQTVVLDKATRTKSSTLRIPAQHQLALHAYTSDPDAHIEVRRV